ncbi:helix-turn-helix domain containing protein [Sporolactobacillus shoreicorticis]|uniref:Helix-turn-helix domain-containing protein n=1 Tax=Sporolactobacillus shoreicorticis TaxID=1923877 RepID=A0ABW5S102_9BACL|nr:helix-turn-helix domain-containing protein [Sporolactobacillus shoreicorticis]MCO7128265.1 helix-turn-helix domain containing protein [Sporolactobacillus shoreicorticis]
MNHGRKTTALERIEIAQWILVTHRHYHGAVEKFNISYSQAYLWTRKYEQGGESALIDRGGK